MPEWLLFFGVPALVLLVLGALLGPKLEGTSVADLLGEVWWLLSVLSVASVLLFVFGEESPFFGWCIIAWLGGACFGLGVILRQVGSDMSPPDQY